jgi:hypothetical protein
MKTDPSRTAGEENKAGRMLHFPLKINELNSFSMVKQVFIFLFNIIV